MKRFKLILKYFSENKQIMNNLSDHDREAFWRDGFFILRNFVDIEKCVELRNIAEEHLFDRRGPIEYEVDLQYPGSPRDVDAEGGATSRRLLQAFARHKKFRYWAQAEQVVAILSKLFDSAEISLTQSHHNCVMTKQPGYSSDTGWHQDNRYWSFCEENLITVWLALGAEEIQNGCLHVIKGSHRQRFHQDSFDEAQFLRTDLAENRRLVDKSMPVELAVGDVLFFHSRLLHAAGRNLEDKPKLSLVFTYHTKKNRPIENSRSARFPEICLIK